MFSLLSRSLYNIISKSFCIYFILGPAVVKKKGVTSNLMPLACSIFSPPKNIFSKKSYSSFFLFLSFFLRCMEMDTHYTLRTVSARIVFNGALKREKSEWYGIKNGRWTNEVCACVYSAPFSFSFCHGRVKNPTDAIHMQMMSTKI